MTHLSDLPRAAKPFVKWVGGKRQLLTEIFDAMPTSWESYYEPFVGGGAVFWNIARPGPTFLSDANQELITTYEVVKDSVETLIALLRRCSYDSKFFYEMRAREPEDEIETAVRLIYLNRTCFNGLYRVNASNRFNVPFGRYTNPVICDADNLRACSRALAKTNIRCCGYQETLDKMKPGDFVYCDPPYAVVSKTANFTSYTKDGFSGVDQDSLAAHARVLKLRGVHVLLSNADTPRVRELYHDFTLIPVQARRAVNSKASGRGKVGELLIK